MIRSISSLTPRRPTMIPIDPDPQDHQQGLYTSEDRAPLQAALVAALEYEHLLGGMPREKFRPGILRWALDERLIESRGLGLFRLTEAGRQEVSRV